MTSMRNIVGGKRKPIKFLWDDKIRSDAIQNPNLGGILLHCMGNGWNIKCMSCGREHVTIGCNYKIHMLSHGERGQFVGISCSELCHRRVNTKGIEI
jgi:hypothetical protein